MDVSSSRSFLFIIFMCKQVGHHDGKMGCNKGVTVVTAQTGLLYLFKIPSLLHAIRVVMHLFPSTIEGGGDQMGGMVHDSQTKLPFLCTCISEWPTVHP